MYRKINEFTLLTDKERQNLQQMEDIASREFIKKTGLQTQRARNQRRQVTRPITPAIVVNNPHLAALTTPDEWKEFIRRNYGYFDNELVGGV